MTPRPQTASYRERHRSLYTHNGPGARGRPAVREGGTALPSARTRRRLRQSGPVALAFVAGLAAPRAAAQAAVDGAEVGGVQRQVGPLLAADDVVDGTRPGVAAEVAQVRGGQDQGAYSAPRPAGGAHGSP